MDILLDLQQQELINLQAEITDNNGDGEITIEDSKVLKHLHSIFQLPRLSL